MTDFNDPRTLEGVEMPGHRAGFDYTPWFKVQGWTPNGGGSCSYQDVGNLDAALTMARSLRENGDPVDGRRYQNYDVLEINFRIVAVTTVHDVPTDKETP